MNKLFYIVCSILSMAGFAACRSTNQAAIDDTGTFVKMLGGTKADSAAAVVVLADGSIVGTGYTESFTTNGVSDAFWFKTDQYGNARLRKGIGGIAGTDIKTTPDGGFVVLGHTLVNDTTYLYLVKTNGEGEIQWTKTFRPRLEEAFQVQSRTLEISNTGEYWLLGNLIYPNNTSDIYIVKTDATGNTLRERIYGSEALANNIAALRQVNDEQIVFCGSAALTGNQSLVRVTAANPLGNLVWSYTYPAQGRDVGTDIQIAPSGFVVSGTNTTSGSTKALLMRLDNYGTMLWRKAYTSDDPQTGKSVYATQDGGYVLLGTTAVDYKGARQTDLLVMKINVNGDTEWTRTFGSTENDRAGFITQAPNGNYLVFATTGFVTSSMASLIMIAPNGDFR